MNYLLNHSSCLIIISPLAHGSNSLPKANSIETVTCVSTESNPVTSSARDSAREISYNQSTSTIQDPPTTLGPPSLQVPPTTEALDGTETRDNDNGTKRTGQAGKPPTMMVGLQDLSKSRVSKTDRERESARKRGRERERESERERERKTERERERVHTSTAHQISARYHHALTLLILPGPCDLTI